MDEGDDDFLPSLPPPQQSKKSPGKQRASPAPAKSPKKAKRDSAPKKVNTSIDTQSNITSTPDADITNTNTTTPNKPKGRVRAKGDGKKGRGGKTSNSGNDNKTRRWNSNNKRRASGEKVDKGGRGGDNKEKKEKRIFVNRPVPYFKTIPGTEFLVDAFNFKNDSCKHYFLTHFHSDHYTGISKGWHHGIIYCSPITAKLLQHKIGVSPEFIREIPLDVEVTVENAQVCFLDANHCPGAAMILFKFNNSTILHTGDFRYDPKMQLYNTLQANKVDVLYLDNTFCNPKFNFPAQSSVIHGIADLVQKELQNGKPLILIGSYVIGKERVLMEVAKRCNQKIFVPQDKFDILSCLEIDMSIFTVYPGQTPIHCVRMNIINYPGLSNVYNAHKNGYSKVVGIMPTGWSASRNPITRKDYPNFSIVTAAYSEHSSYTELVKCVEWLRPTKIVPTVDCNTPEKIKEILSHFKGKTDNSRNLNTLFPYFAPKSAISSHPPATSSPSPVSSLSSSTSSQTTSTMMSQKGDDEFEMDDIDLALLRSLMDESGNPYECGCDSEPEIDEEGGGAEEEDVVGGGKDAWATGNNKKNKKAKSDKNEQGEKGEKTEKTEINMIKITPKKTPSSSSLSSSFASFDEWEALSNMTDSSPCATSFSSPFQTNNKNNNNTTSSSFPSSSPSSPFPTNNNNNSSNNTASITSTSLTTTPLSSPFSSNSDNFSCDSTPTTPSSRPSPSPSPSSSPFSTPSSTPPSSFCPSTPTFSLPPAPPSFPSTTSGKTSTLKSPFAVSPSAAGGKKEKEGEEEVFDVHMVDKGFIEKQRLIEHEIMENLKKKASSTPSKYNIPPPPPTPDNSKKARAKLQANKTPSKKGKVETSPAQPSISSFFQSKFLGSS